MSIRIPSHEWRKAAASGLSNCVEIRAVDGQVDIRDSKNPEDGHLRVPARSFSMWIASLKELH